MLLAPVAQPKRADTPTPRSTSTTTTTTTTSTTAPRSSHGNADGSKGEPTKEASGAIPAHKSPSPSVKGASTDSKRQSSGGRATEPSRDSTKVPQSRASRRRLVAGRRLMARADDQTARPEGGGGRSGVGGGVVVGGFGGGGGSGCGGNVRGGNLSSTTPHKVPKLRLEIDPQHFDLLNEMQLKDAWRVAALRLPSVAAATTAAATTSTSTTAAAAAAALLPPGASGVQLRPLPSPRGSGNFTPYLFVDFPLLAMAHGTHPQPPTVLCLDAVSATALFRSRSF